MTQRSIHEYAEALRPRYLAARRTERSRLLEEFCQTTGYHRKSAIRVLRHPRTPTPGRQGRPRQYGPAVVEAVRRLWELSDYLCAKRLVPFLPELVRVLERQSEIALAPTIRDQVLQLSPATVDRMLGPVRRTVPGRPYAQSTASAAVRAHVPIRTWSDWADVAPGAVQVDLVLHCGESTEGFYLTTLTMVDVRTSWTECTAVWGKGQERVGAAVHRLRQRLPFALRELHSDNGGEFLNHGAVRYCQREGLRYTRGRPYKKNDQAYAEQKNGWVVRGRVGYDRYASKAAYAEVERFYQLFRLYGNFFQPVRKLIGKEREGGRVHKRYDRAQTPYQRLVATGVLTEEAQEKLEQLYQGLNPVEVRAEMEATLERLWKLAERESGKRAIRRASAGTQSGTVPVCVPREEARAHSG